MILRAAVPDGNGGKAFVEVEAVLAGDAGGLFALRQADDEDEAASLGGRWLLTHIPSGVCVGGFTDRQEAAYVARQLYSAAPEAWALPDHHAVMRALPAAVNRWAALVKQAAARGVPVELLKGCAEFTACCCRER